MHGTQGGVEWLVEADGPLEYRGMGFNKLKTTPTPIKTVRGGSRAIFWGSVCHILILTDFYAAQTPIVWHILGAYFL